MAKANGIFGAVACLLALMSFGYDVSTITEVDWSAQSGTYTVPAGQTNLDTEADDAVFRKLNDERVKRPPGCEGEGWRK